MEQLYNLYKNKIKIPFIRLRINRLNSQIKGYEYLPEKDTPELGNILRECVRNPRYSMSVIHSIMDDIYTREKVRENKKRLTQKLYQL